jgi:hypothetical protein
MSISGLLAVIAEVALVGTALLALAVAPLLFALLYTPGRRVEDAGPPSLADQAAATVPNCFCASPEFDVLPVRPEQVPGATRADTPAPAAPKRYIH